MTTIPKATLPQASCSHETVESDRLQHHPQGNSCLSSTLFLGAGLCVPATRLRVWNQHHYLTSMPEYYCIYFALVLGFDVGIQGWITEIGLATGAGKIPTFLVLASTPSFLLLLVVGFLPV